MKKVLFLIPLIIASCIQPQTPEPLSQDVIVATLVEMTMIAGNSASQSATPEPETSVDNQQNIGDLDVDQGLFDVEITIPASIFSSEDTSQIDLEAYANESGFKKAVLNPDGSVTVTLSKSDYAIILDELRNSLNQSFAELVGAPDTPYITNIISDRNFTQVIVDVDRVGYEAAFDLTPLVIGIESMYYQIFADVEQHVEVVIRDKDTGETIGSVIYPDVFNE
ncbi:MAG: hypothetical protein PWQ55_367 [Chloroflexota bacterium]|nr:hypothetical protein [Chloroflexota bacterium]